MKVKGKATIELTDINTGEVETIVEDNLVTNAVNLFYKQVLHSECAAQTSFMMLTHSSQPAVYDIFGGIMLFDEALEENVDNIEYPNCNVVGTAKAGYSNNDGVKVGSYNASESGALEDGYRFVYDFTTSQCNGQIASVCLTPLRAAEFPHGALPSEYSALSTGATYTSLLPRYRISPETSYSYASGVISRDVITGDLLDKVVFFDDSYAYTIKRYNIYYNSSYPSIHISATDKLVLEKRIINGNIADVFGTTGGWDVVEEIEIPIPDGSTQNTYTCEYLNGYLYLQSITSVSAGNSLVIYKIEVGTWVVTTIEVTNNCEDAWNGADNYGHARIMLPGNKMLVNTTYVNDRYVGRYIIVDLEDGSFKYVIWGDGSTLWLDINTYSTRQYPSRATNNYCYISSYGFCVEAKYSGTKYPNGTAIVNINTGIASFTTHWTPRCCGGNYSASKYNKSSHLYFYGFEYYNSADRTHVEFNPFLLMTINNLSSPVVKTPDKTMKITYTLYADDSV